MAELFLILDEEMEGVGRPRLSDIAFKRKPAAKSSTKTSKKSKKTNVKNTLETQKARSTNIEDRPEFMKRLVEKGGVPGLLTVNTLRSFPERSILMGTPLQTYEEIKKNIAGNTDDFPDFIYDNPENPILSSAAAAGYLHGEGNPKIIANHGPDQMKMGGYYPYWVGQPATKSATSHEMGHAMQFQGYPRLKNELDTLLALSEIAKDDDIAKLRDFRAKRDLGWDPKNKAVITGYYPESIEPQADMLGYAIDSYLTYPPAKSRLDSVLGGLTIPEGSVLLKNPEKYLDAEGNVVHTAGEDSDIVSEIKKRLERASAYFFEKGLKEVDDTQADNNSYPITMDKRAKQMLTDILEKRGVTKK